MASLDNCGDVFGDEILMLHRSDRVVHAHHCADLVHAITARIHHDFGVDRTVWGFDLLAVIGQLSQARDRRVAVHLSTGFAGVKGQRLAKLSWVDVAVFAIPEST